MIEWKTGKPKPSKKGVKCDHFLAVGKHSDVATIENYHHEISGSFEKGWQDNCGNKIPIRLWAVIPDITGWREVTMSDYKRAPKLDRLTLISNRIRILALGCKSRDAFSCDFGNEFAPRVREYLAECFGEEFDK